MPIPQEQLYPGMRVGLLGGSFNPAHAGHRHISVIALKRLNLDRVWWVVSSQNPLKSAEGMADLEDRIASAHAASRHPRIVVSRVEQRLQTRYTADTLQELRRRWPRVHFVWLMGADNLVQLPAWREWNRILHLLPIAVLDRPGSGLKGLKGKAALRYHTARLSQERASQLATRTPPAWSFIACRRHPASSTAIREGRQE